MAMTWQQMIPAFAALIGAVIGSTLTFFYGRWMEPYKQNIAFDIRRKEIRYSKLHDKRLETLEGVHGRLFKLSETLSVLTALFQTPKTNESGEITDEDIRLDRRGKIYKVAEALNSLKEYHEGRSIYLPEQLDEKIKQFRKEIAFLVNRFNTKMEFTAQNAREIHDAWNEIMEGFDAKKLLIEELVREFRRLSKEDEI